MRCLCCGKELALLKKLTGGGEFCSEAHRQKYQEEYNRLALSRLLQAQPAADNPPPLEKTSPNRRTVSRPAVPQAGRAASAELSAESRDVAVETLSAPPPAGFILDPVQSRFGGLNAISPDPLLSSNPARLPTPESWNGSKPYLEDPGSLPLPDMKAGWGTRPRQVHHLSEPREFGRPMPNFEIPLPEQRFYTLPLALEPQPVCLSLLPIDAMELWSRGPCVFFSSCSFEENFRAVISPAAQSESRVEDMLDFALKSFHDGLIEGLAVGDSAEFPNAVDEEPDAHLEQPAVLPVPPEESSLRDTAIVLAAEGAVIPHVPAKAKPAAPIDEPLRVAHLTEVAAPTVVVDLSMFEATSEETPKFPTGRWLHPPEIRLEAPSVDQHHAGEEPVKTAVPLFVEAEPASPIEEPLAPRQNAVRLQPAKDVLLEPHIPEMFETPFNLDLKPRAAGVDKRDGMRESLSGTKFRVALPTSDPAPIRPKLVYGPRPEKLEGSIQPTVEPGASEVPEAIEAPRPETRRAQKPGRSGKVAVRSVARPSARAATEGLVAEPPPVVDSPGVDKIPPLAELGRAAKVRPLHAKPAPQHDVRASLDLDGLRLNLEHSNFSTPTGGPWSRMNVKKRIAVGTGLLVAAVLAGFFLTSGVASKGTPVTKAANIEPVGASLVAGQGGWSSDWAGAGSGRRIALLRSSASLSDYRIEFQGQIEQKSIGWIFRGVNSRNFYAQRIEMTKSGLSPTVIIAHFTVINGEDAQRTEKPIPFPVHLDTTYKVRTDVFGSQFKTYLGDTLVDSWSDDRFKTGGFGLLSEAGDRTQVRLVQLFELRAGK